MRSDESEVLADQIYEASIVPELWPTVLQSFARKAGADHAVLVAQREGFNRYIASSAEFEMLVHSHFELFRTNERTKRLVALRHPGFVTDRDVFTDAEMAVEPVYRDFWFRRGYGNGVATTIFAPSGDMLVIHAECPRAKDPVSRETVTRLDELRPHFARAALLSARLDLERARAVSQALELLGLPGAVLRHNGCVLAANSPFARLMPEVVQDRTSRLTLTDAAADGLFVEALQRFAVSTGDVVVGSIPIAARAQYPPMIVHVIPVRGAAHDVFSGATAILIVTPVATGKGPSPEVLQGLFDLTPAEARLAGLVGAGLRPREAAVHLGIAEETARSTLKRVLAKTGMRRQAELVGLLQAAVLRRNGR